MSGNPILAVVSDLMLQSRLQDQARALGYEIASADTAEAVRYGLDRSPALLVIDLQVAGLDWSQVVEAAKEGSVPVLAFGRHTEGQLLRSAREAGCGLVVPRSTFVDELPQLIDKLLDLKTFTSQYICPDGHVTVGRRGAHENAVICMHPRLGDDTDPLIDNADICGKNATLADKR